MFCCGTFSASTKFCASAATSTPEPAPKELKSFCAAVRFAAATSAAVHVAKIGTGLASGLAHWRHDNVDREVLFKIAIPGGIGAFAGATFLSSIDLAGGTYFISTILLLLGLVLLYRNIFRHQVQVNLTAVSDPKYALAVGHQLGGRNWTLYRWDCDGSYCSKARWLVAKKDPRHCCRSHHHNS